MINAALVAMTLLSQIPNDGDWNAALTSPGGDLPFILEFVTDDGRLQAFVRNGPERIEVPTVSLRGDQLLLRFDHYDSEIRATLDGSRLEGEWTKIGARGARTVLPFRADHAPLLSGTPIPRTDELPTRHLVDFESGDDPAVLLIDYEDTDDPWRRTNVVATFLTTTGDYRYLAGTLRQGRLTLSVFDGAHAFLFKAMLAPDGSLSGDFWSRDTWHETWTSEPDPDASLPDAFTQTTINDDFPLDDLVFLNLDGEPTRLTSLRALGQPMVIKVFGSWCPNCHDAGAELSRLSRDYPDIAFVGLAFEHTEDHERSARQVRAYAERWNIDFPILIAGLSDKTKATQQLRILDRVRSFPTTIFINGDGTVRAVHTGFTGPATGAAYDDLRDEFRRLLDQLSGGGS